MISFNRLDLLHNEVKIKSEILDAVERSITKSEFILGTEVQKFENNFSVLSGVKYGIGIDNGLNAISIGINALGLNPGDEIIVQANTYIATILGVVRNHLKPVLVEPDYTYNIDPLKIEEKITSKTKAVLITHLYGQASNMDAISVITKRHGLYLMEDCAQAHFSTWKGKVIGSFGVLSFFSFYPSKPLGALGDAGLILTDNEQLRDKIISLRNYGKVDKYNHKVIGFNARLDEVQAAILNVKLNYFNLHNSYRTNIAIRYLNEIRNEFISLPLLNDHATHVWHLFVVRVEKREMFLNYLRENKIGFEIHYPIPPHLDEALNFLGHRSGDFPLTEKFSNQVVSLPLYYGMTESDVNTVIYKLNEYIGV